MGHYTPISVAAIARSLPGNATKHWVDYAEEIIQLGNIVQHLADSDDPKFSDFRLLSEEIVGAARTASALCDLLSAQRPLFLCLHWAGLLGRLSETPADVQESELALAGYKIMDAARVALSQTSVDRSVPVEG